MTLLDREAVLGAAHACYAGEYASEAEARGQSFSQCELTEVIARQPDEKQLPIVYYYLGRIAQAWGHDIGLVFYHAGISEAEQEHALYKLLYGCLGHGVSLADDYSEALAKAGAVLGRRFDPSPICFEGTEWRELAEEALVAAQGAN